MLLLHLSACSLTSNNPQPTASQPTLPPDNSQQVDVAPVYSSEDYLSELNSISLEIDESYQFSLSVDFDNPQDTLSYVNAAKEVYQKLLDLQAPPELMDAQDKLAAGARNMLEYLDLVPDFRALENGDPDADDQRLVLVDLYANAAAFIAEGFALANAGGDGGDLD